MRREALKFWLAAVAWMVVGGCVKAYHPMSGFHRPIVADPGAANFEDTRLIVRCEAGELVNRQEASNLCQKVAQLFENQGAEVVDLADGRSLDDALEDVVPSETPRPITLRLDLDSRLLHSSNRPVSWILFAGTFTLAPGILEHTFAQDVTVRDESGFLLATDGLKGRIVYRVGLGPYYGTKIVGWTQRKEERIDITRDVSSDLYGQLTQIVYNARNQARVLALSPGAQP